MSVAVWAAAGFLALVYLALGVMKVALPIDRITKQMAWAHIAPVWQVRAVGVLSLLGALGLVLPESTGILPAMSVAAAAGLTALQVGAIVAHIRMGGDAIKSIPLNVFLLLLAVFTAIGFAALPS